VYSIQYTVELKDYFIIYICSSKIKIKKDLSSMKWFSKKGKNLHAMMSSPKQMRVSLSLVDFLHINICYLGWSLGVGPSLQCDEVYDSIS
jgi:hypothetical protein